MYPTTLNMTRDECRGVLRRLELESYSNVVSAFRAQGGLNETKMKILEDLRSVFHISQDRHRAEARRVANDEQLSTIAEAISGPNTYQEWCREGRRSFPLLPRAAPLTALSTVANGVAEVVTDENSKLPYPTETVTERLDEIKVEEDSSKVVQEDPVLSASEEKKKLKRSLSLADHISAAVPDCKKRMISGEGLQTVSQAHVHTNTKIQQLYHNHSKTQSRHKKALSKRNAVTPKKLNLGQGKTSQAKITKTPEVQPVENKAHVLNPRTLHTYASLPQHKISAGPVVELDPYGANKMPQIATSKKDITNNLSKLNLSQISQQGHGQNVFMTENELKTDKAGISTQKFIPEDRLITGSSYPNEIPKANVISAAYQSGRCTIKPGPLVVGTKYHIKTKPPEVTSSVMAIVDPTISNNEIARQSATHPPPPLTAVSRPEEESGSTNLVSISEQMASNVEMSSLGNDVKKISTSPMVMNTGQLQTQSITKGNTQHIANKPKIQITSQQIINPIVGNIKLPVGMQLKGVQNRKGVKILSSSSGKMFIQPFDSSKPITKLSAVVAQKSIAGASVVTTNPISSARPLTVQKVQLVPTSNSKQIAISKPNMIFMPANMGTTSNVSNTILRSLPISKRDKPQTGIGEKGIDDMQFSNLSRGANNVFVIGAFPTEKMSTKEEAVSINNTNMITEDTPVDILTTPIANVENSPLNNLPKEGEPYDTKSSIVRTISLNSGEPIHKAGLNRDFHMMINPNESTEVVDLKLEENIHTKRDESKQRFIIGTATDWEMELDQEANKIRCSNDRNSDISRKFGFNTENNNNEGGTSTISDDNFHDVIEEETVDDEEEGMISENTCETEEGMEFDVTCGSVTDDVDEHVAIEYVEDTTGNSFEEEEALYGDEKVDNTYGIGESDLINNRGGSKEHGREALNNNTSRLQFNRVESVSNGNLNLKKCLESPTTISEMQQIDEIELRQTKNLGRASADDIDITSSGASCTKKSISK